MSCAFAGVEFIESPATMAGTAEMSIAQVANAVEMERFATVMRVSPLLLVVDPRLPAIAPAHRGLRFSECLVSSACQAEAKPCRWRAAVPRRLFIQSAGCVPSDGVA